MEKKSKDSIAIDATFTLEIDPVTGEMYLAHDGKRVVIKDTARGRVAYPVRK